MVSLKDTKCRICKGQYRLMTFDLTCSVTGKESTYVEGKECTECTECDYKILTSLEELSVFVSKYGEHV